MHNKVVYLVAKALEETLRRLRRRDRGRAIDELPGEVSLAFLPGTPDLPRWLRAFPAP